MERDHTTWLYHRQTGVLLASSQFCDIWCDSYSTFWHTFDASNESQTEMLAFLILFFSHSA